MPETNNTSSLLSNGKNDKNPWLKKLATIALAASLLFSENIKAENWNNAPKNDKLQIELATTLQSWQEAFQFWDEEQDKIKSKEEMTIDIIKNNLYINGKSVNNLENVIIKKENNTLYSVEFDHEFLEWTQKIKLFFTTRYENNSIFFNFQNWEFPEWIWKTTGKPVTLPTNKTIEIDPTTHNNYDVRTIWNWKRENFNIVYNDIKTKETIENIVKEKSFLAATRFEHIDELENTQLEALEKPKLWKEVFKEDFYYRTLFYSTNWKKFDVTNIYFNPNWELNLEKTLENKTNLTILWINVEYNITASKDTIVFTITEQSKQELIEKVKQDRAVLINMINNTKIIAPDEIFSWLNKNESALNFQSKTSYLSLNPITWIYNIKLNTENQLEPLHCTVKWNNVTLVAETWKPINEFHANYKPEENNNYKITKNGQGLSVNKIRNEIENPRENLPYYTWDIDATNLIRTFWTQTNYNWYLNHYDINWILVTKIPCDKQEDESYKFNKDKKHTEIKAIKLYRYPWFEEKIQEINSLIVNLWITDAEIRKIFEESLKNDWFEFNQEVVEFKNPETWKSIYYNIDKNFNITLDNDIYTQVWNRLDFIKQRLKLAEIINNSHIKWRNGYQYKDFEKFIWWETWIGKQIISPEQLRKFVSWESNEITIKISRWNWQYTDIIYTADKYGWFSSKLKSWEKKWSVNLNGQRYTINTVDKNNLEQIHKELKRKKMDTEINLNCWDIIVDPKEERE